MIVHYYGHHQTGSGLGGIFARIFGRIVSKVAAKTAIRGAVKVARTVATKGLKTGAVKVARTVATKGLKTVAKKAIPLVKEAGISLAAEAAKYGAVQAAQAVKQAAQKAKQHGVPSAVVDQVTAVARQGIKTGSEKLQRAVEATKPKSTKSSRKRKNPTSQTPLTKTVYAQQAKRRKVVSKSPKISKITPVDNTGTYLNPHPTPPPSPNLSYIDTTSEFQTPSSAVTTPRRNPKKVPRRRISTTAAAAAQSKSKHLKTSRRRVKRPKTRTGLTQALIDSL